MNIHRERELKFDVPDGFHIPALAGLRDGDVRSEPRTVHITSTYYDTDDRALLSSGLTLRRREGEVDAGWQLKVPAGAARTEIQLPREAGAAVPEQIQRLLVGVLRGRSLSPVAVVETERVQHQLRSEHGLLLEVADDHVRGTVLGPAAIVRTWREIEAELGPAGDEELLAGAAAVLTDAGAVVAAVPSKLARTLDVAARAAVHDARSAIVEYVSEQWTAMVAGDIGLRRGLDAVHKTRVAVRRLRSVLRLLRPVLESDHVADLDAELSWYQHLLGDVRDQQVQRKRAADRLAALPAEDVLGPVAAHVDQSLLREQLQRRSELDEAMNSARYLALLDAVAAWTAAPPASPELDGKALRRGVRKAARKARARLAVAVERDEPALLHRARKAVKRARYATELVQPLRGKGAKRKIKRYKRVQDVLGEHQDSIVAAGILRGLATRSAEANSAGFTLGLLYGIEQAAGREARRRAGELKL